jgi:hypothetical protein
MQGVELNVAGRILGECLRLANAGLEPARRNERRQHNQPWHFPSDRVLCSATSVRIVVLRISDKHGATGDCDDTGSRGRPRQR